MSLPPNYHRMFTIIDEVFSTRNDPNQLQVDETVMQKLGALHEATLGEIADENGPLIWVLLIPTSREVMERFLADEISERQLLDHTQAGETYTCLYLCSVTTLPEKRGQGATKKLCLENIEAIRADFPIEALYVWAFSEAGERLAEALGRETALPVFKKQS